MLKSHAFNAFIIVFAGVSYIAVHEFGHFIVAAIFNLHPLLVHSGITSGFLTMSLGIAHVPGTAAQNTLVILGSILLPAMAAMLLMIASAVMESDELALFSEIFLLFIVITLVPIPGASQLDANRIWAAMLNL